MQTYFYKLGRGEWQAFALSQEDGLKWRQFCNKLQILRPENPNPYYDDYLEFFKILKDENKN